MWDLYKQQPVALHHPDAGIIPCAAVSPINDGVAWWNANYMLAAAMPGGMIGASGFPLNPIEGGTPEWNEADKSWYMRVERSSGTRVYRFALPDAKMQSEWDRVVKQYLDPINKLHEIAAKEYGGQE